MGSARETEVSEQRSLEEVTRLHPIPFPRNLLGRSQKPQPLQKGPDPTRTQQTVRMGPEIMQKIDKMCLCPRKRALISPLRSSPVWGIFRWQLRVAHSWAGGLQPAGMLLKAGRSAARQGGRGERPKPGRTAVTPSPVSQESGPSSGQCAKAGGQRRARGPARHLVAHHGSSCHRRSAAGVRADALTSFL